MRLLSSLFPLSFIFYSSLASANSTPVTINALVEQTLAENPEIKFYEAEVAYAKTTQKKAALWANPELSVDAGRKTVHGLGSSSSGLAWSVGLAQPFEWPGRISLRKAIANSEVELAELGVAKFKQVLAGKVRTLAFSLAMHQEREAAAAEVQQRLVTLRDTIVQRDPAGITPLLEAKIIEAAAIVLEKKAADAAAATQKALLELNQLRGHPADERLVVQSMQFTFPTYPSLSQLLSQTAAHNYDLKTRLREFQSQGLKVSLARNERFPTFSLGPMISQERSGDRETVIGIGVSLPLPIWDNGGATVDAAEARRIQAQVLLMTTQREIERQVTEAALKYETLRKRLVVWKTDSLASFKEAAALADRHYRLGAVEMPLYIELQEKYLEAMEAINETKSAALEAALGAAL